MVADPRAREYVDRSLLEEARLWPDFLLQVTLSFARPFTVDEMAARGMLSDETSRFFRTPGGDPFRLYHHQVEVMEKAGLENCLIQKA